MPKKNDNRVGESDGPAFNGGRQTAQQADIVKQEGGGLTDQERRRSLEGQSRRSDPAVGGSSNGHSDQLAAKGPNEDTKVAGGLSLSERTKGEGERAQDEHQPPS
jgi:hypothetical protein